MVYISYQEFVTSPILTSMDSDSYSTIDLNFPGMEIKQLSEIYVQYLRVVMKIYLLSDVTIILIS